MWIVKLALRRPYTFVVLAILILLAGPLTIVRTPTDIFPSINIPVVAAVFQYNGLSAEEMGDRIVFPFERVITTTVNDIEHIESQSVRGVSVVKIFLQPNGSVDLAIAQTTATAQSSLRNFPPGTLPPIVLSLNASSVPVIQLGLSGKGFSEQQIYDLGNNFLRVQLATVQGAQIPLPFGGKQPQIQVDLDAAALQAKGLSANDVVNAIGAQNLILPGGTQKIGAYEYDVALNGSPKKVDELNDLPIRTVRGNTTYIRDVAHVRNGFPPQTNIVRVNGQRAALMAVMKSGNASTLDIIQRTKEVLTRAMRGMPAEFEVRPLADQSVFVRASIDGVLREAAIAACLTALMILLFLGSWRSTLIIAISIPLSILASIITLSALGETINIMTLGGLALAVGILVDDATVEIENINRNLAQGKPTEQAILDGAQQIAIPAFVSTICICIVFVPMFFLTGVGRYLFVPMAEAVVFAMLASYGLSRTLVPTMAKYLLRPHPEDPRASLRSRNPLVRLQGHFEVWFEALREVYRSLLQRVVAHRAMFVVGFLLCCVASFALLPWVGEDFFPAVDGGQFKLHVRVPMGTRIEETAALCDRIEQVIRDVIPSHELVSITDNIGLPYSGLNLAYSTSAPVGPGDADIMVALAREHHPSAGYMHDLRRVLPQRFPGVLFSAVPADIVTQILNFGLPAPIDIQVVGRDTEGNRQFAARLTNKLRLVPGITDLRVHQVFNQPRLQLEVDRAQATQVGLTERDIATNLLVSLSGSMQTTPTFWLNPATGVTYNVASQTPQYRVNSLQDLGNIPLTAPGGSQPQVLQGLASITRGAGSALASHYNVQLVLDIFASVQGRDLGSTSREISRQVAAAMKDLPRGSQINVRGQIETMTSSFIGLGAGLALAIVLVYLLIVVNFQSWLDPLIIISALPAALAGIVWMLFTTKTTFSVPSLTGSIMCMGVATANSILVVSFAKEELERGRSALDAALEAGFTRFRPVLMTALAMMMGMAPMALGIGEGAEQNAPLGRAVIGGLLFATVATLLFVPSLYALLHGRSTHGRAVTEPSVVRTAQKTGSVVGPLVSALILLLAAIAIASWGIVTRARTLSVVAKETRELAVQPVAVVGPTHGAPQQEIILPGTLQAFADTPIYARSNGYLMKRYVDIGTRVRAGQPLADIDAPEVDRQLEQARADLGTADANARLAQLTYGRYKDLVTSESVAQQDLDNAKGTFEARRTAVESALANVRRYEQLQAFGRIVAPFDGVITARNTDVGALIAAGSAAQELFHIAAVHRLRLFVNVPELYSRVARPGVKANLTLREFPGRTFVATLVRTAQAIDVSSRTLLTEFDVDNARGELLPGAAAGVQFHLPSPTTPTTIPVDTLMFRAGGLRLAIVRDGRVMLTPIVLGRDYGNMVEVVAGLKGDEAVVVNPLDSLESGQVVRVVAAASANDERP